MAYDVRWRVSYAADLVSTGQIWFIDGSLWLRREAVRIVLLDADGGTVDADFSGRESALTLICNVAGHTTARCPQVVCDRCKKKGHLSMICVEFIPWEFMPVMCAFQAKGRGFFYIPDFNAERQTRDRNYNIIVTITEGFALTKDIEAELSVAKFSPWTDDLDSEGLLEVEWVKIGRISINKRCDKTVAYVGGEVGITLEVDMSTLNRPASVRAKIGCRHVDQITASVEGVLGGRFYEFTYEVEEALVKNVVAEETKVPVARDGLSKQNLTPKRKREHQDHEKEDSYPESSGLTDLEVQVSELEGEVDPSLEVSKDYVVLSPDPDINVEVIPTPPIASETDIRFSKRNAYGMQKKVEDKARRLAYKKDLEGLQQEHDAGELRSGAEMVRSNTMQLMKMREAARQEITGE
ncbi:hypothetical protein D1007_29581 [Hordeum vulgare]|nr:hypothetical protein D1007_29581 [Hordeum vulgare]